MSDQLQVLYDDHMGTDLKVVNAAKVSFGRRSKWEIPPGVADASPKLFDRDINLINYLARGVMAKEFERTLDLFPDVTELARIRDMTEAEFEAFKARLDNYPDRDELRDILNKWRDTPLHRSPFNHVSLSVTCRAPIHIARQLVKHEYLVWNEASGRYIEFKHDFFMPEVIRARVEDKKQGSGEPLSGDQFDRAVAIFGRAHDDAYERYQELLKLGVCEEQARGVLPLNTMTEWVWTGSLGAFAKMAKLRFGSDAQAEATEIAKQIGKIAAAYFPVSWDALMTNGV